MTLPMLSELSRFEQDAVYELQRQGFETRDAIKLVVESRTQKTNQGEQHESGSTSK